MGLFSFFKSRKNAEEPEVTLPEIKEEDFVDNSEPTKDVVSIPYGTGMSIDAVYEFIKKDYEEIGYNEALSNQDSSYKNEKVIMIKGQIKTRIEQVRLRYDGDLRNIKTQIGNSEEEGLANTASILKARQETIMKHLDVMADMESKLENKEDEFYIISSYKRGFKKGLVAQTNTLLNKGKYNDEQ